jgi:hypothetical protein
MNEILTGYNEQGALNRHPVSFATAIQFLIIFKNLYWGDAFLHKYVYNIKRA